MRQRSPNPLLASAMVMATAILGGCAAPAAPGQTAPAHTAAPKPAEPQPTARFNASPDVPAAVERSGILLVGRSGSTNLKLVVAETGESIMDVPDGAMDPAWGRVVTAKADTVGTITRDVATEDSSAGVVLDVKGRWRVPTIGTDRVPVGVSADGSTFALVSADEPADSAKSSRFAIVQHVEGSQPTRTRTAPLRLTRVIELPGSFEFDAISPDGSILYVAEHLDGETGAYQVRAVDVATGELRDGVIVDKRNIGEAMAGWPLGQVRRSDGMVLTIYRGTAHPFIHALNTIDAWAVCIDLPSSGASDTSAAGDWGIVADPAGRSVYAVNATLGLAAEINATELVVKRTSSLGTASIDSPGAPRIVLAKFGHGEVGVAGRVVIFPDGETVWASGANGVVSIATRDLSVSRRMLAGTPVDGIAVAPDGSVLYALTRTGGRIVAVDRDTGRELGSVPGDGFERLVAAAP
ncbi:MAG TPA: hypothetical protein VIM39_10255 [Candidatus Limnocylindrales bacterium]